MSHSFYHLKNHICRDPICDWFELHDRYRKDEPSAFHVELGKQKVAYIANFVDNFRYTHSTIFHDNLDSEHTSKLLKDKKDCILYNCELLHEGYHLRVKPNLIFSRDIFREIFSEVTIDLPEYVVVDVLYKILHFNADQTDLLNQGSLYYQKCKMWLASECLSPHVKGLRHGYLFGKEYRHRDKVLPKRETIGRFLLGHRDIYKVSIKEALKWLQRLHANREKWVLEPQPSVRELYPNMNRKDSVWSTEKRRVAEAIQEITLVWSISYQKRCILVDKGITKWSDPILLGQIYPYKVKESKRQLVQEQMIHINSQTDLKISPRRLRKPGFIEIVRDQSDSIILDIESTSNLKETESYFEDLDVVEKPRICIIGTILNQGSDDDELIFKDFTIRYLTNEEEEIVIRYWVSFLKKRFKGSEKPIKVYHWGQAEESYLTYMKTKYPKIQYPNFQMINLLNYFREEPITIQGCFGYGLKEIVKQLYNLQLIETTWEEEVSGLDAMTQIMKTSEKALLKNIPLKRFTEIKKMITYNYYDCRVIVDLLRLLETMI
jgi:hypothetical protein